MDAKDARIAELEAERATWKLLAENAAEGIAGLQEVNEVLKELLREARKCIVPVMLAGEAHDAGLAARIEAALAGES
jgi:hypothetical protein